jgi:Nucleotidyl transferase AbiEii toxin, Type IV TA system
MSRLLREDDDFEEAIRIAASALGLDPAFVEKDYWVTQVLRSLAAEYGASIVFKGGTSLSKGYKIIERFSEDVDILVRPLHGASIPVLEGRLKEMTDHVAGELGLSPSEKRSPGRGRQASRGDVIAYDELIQPAVDLPRESDGVLLETGYGDGREPSRVVVITPMLCDPARIDPQDHPDTQPFEIAALLPARTLLEKVILLHHVATCVADGDSSERHGRIGRHYHDVDKLLADKDTLRWLREEGDQGAKMKLIGEIETISKQQYGGCSPRPAAGYCAGPAFAPEPNSDLRTWLAGRYDAARGLMPHVSPAKWPTFNKTLNRIGQHAELL